MVETNTLMTIKDGAIVFYTIESPSNQPEILRETLGKEDQTTGLP